MNDLTVNEAPVGYRSLATFLAALTSLAFGCTTHATDGKLDPDDPDGKPHADASVPKPPTDHAEVDAGAEAGIATPGKGRFYVVGSDIVDPDGNKFFPVGANVGTQLNFDWKGDSLGHSDDALAWGWNTVRLTLSCTTAPNWGSYRTKHGFDGLVKRVEDFVKEYTAKKIVVMIECHDMTSSKSFEGETLASGKTLREEVDDFWIDARDRYKDNPYVWFNPLNEPGWSNNELWLQHQKHYRDLVRATGAENVFVADAQNTGNDAGWDGAKRVYDPTMGPAIAAGQCNMVFSLHAYGGLGGDAAHVAYFDAVRAAGLALIIGEFGYTVNGTSTAGSYDLNVRGASATFNLAADKGVGALVWHATHGDMYSLKANGGAFWAGGGPNVGLSPLGQDFWNMSHKKPNLGKFTGDLKRSHCASASGR